MCVVGGVASCADHERLRPSSSHRNTHNLLGTRGKLNWLFLLFRNACYANHVALYAKAEMQWALRVLLAMRSVAEHRSALRGQGVNPQAVAEMFPSPNLQSTKNYRTCYISNQRLLSLQGGQGEEEGEVRYVPFRGTNRGGSLQHRLQYTVKGSFCLHTIS